MDFSNHRNAETSRSRRGRREAVRPILVNGIEQDNYKIDQPAT
jgi:hypothetical protein